MDATECFGLVETGRCVIDGTTWVLYDDSVHMDAVDAADFDEVPAAFHGPAMTAPDRYSDWCASGRTTFCEDKALFAVILHECDVQEARSGAHGLVAARSFVLACMNKTPNPGAPYPLAVEIPPERAPEVQQADGSTARDPGLADWPTDDEIAAAAEDLLGFPVTVSFGDAGDDPRWIEALYWGVRVE